MSLQDIVNPTEPPAVEAASAVDGRDLKEQKTPMRSWRKKYRKLKLRFDKVMEESNALYMDEHKQIAIARRLQEQNDNLLDLLLDLNEEPQVPDKFELSLPGDEKFGFRTHLPTTLANPSGFHKLSSLLDEVPHTEMYAGIVLPDEMTGDKPPGFLDGAYEEEYLANLDAQLAELDSTAASPTGSLLPLRPPLSRQLPSEKELMATNPNSVISWLKRHHPETFIQEKDQNSERSVAKPRGPGKRASLAAAAAAAAAAGPLATPTGPKSEAPDAAENDDAGSLLHPDDADRKTLGGRGRKSNGRHPEDDAYRPKGGRAGGKRKRNTEGDGETPQKGSGRGKRVKAAAAAAVASMVD